MIIWGHGRRRATVGVSWPGRGDAIRERSAQVGPLAVVHQRQRSAARRGSFLRDVESPRIRRAVAVSASGQFCGNFRTSHALVSRGGERSNSWHRAHLRQSAASPACRHTACVCTVFERTHESHDHLERARTHLPAVPSRPRGVVVPRLERAATVVADTVRGAPVRTAPLHATAAALGLTALLVLHVGAAGTAGAGAHPARARGGFPPAPPPFPRGDRRASPPHLWLLD